VLFGPYGDFYAETAGYLYEPGPLLPFLPALSPVAFYGLKLAVLALSLAFAAGAFTRLSGPLLALAFFVFNYYVSRFGGAQWSYNVHLNLFLGVICFAEASRRLGLDARRPAAESPGAEARTAFALGFMQLYVAVMYLQTALSKLIYGGLGWFWRGETIYTNAILLGGERGQFLAGLPGLPRTLGLLTLAFEGCFFFLFVAGVSRRALGAAAILFHLGTFAALGISFWHLWLLYPALFFAGYSGGAAKNPR
jgi:hypothetical protein